MQGWGCYIIRPQKQEQHLNERQATMKSNSIKPAHHRRITAAGGTACGFAIGPRNRPPSPLPPKPSVSYVLFVPFLTKITLPSRRQLCSSYTFPIENPRAYGVLLIIPSEPNFKTPRQSVTLAMIRTYNDNGPKKHKKSKPDPNPIQTQSKPDPNPIQTQFTPAKEPPKSQKQAP